MKTTQSVDKSTHFHTIVIGGGFGGLAAAALLAHRGIDVVVLEAHTSTGGCAGYFDRFRTLPTGERERYRFDVGATTLTGVAEGRPLDRLFREMGESPAIRTVDPGMVCHLQDGTRVHRWNDDERWIAEAERVFGTAGQRPFWELVHEINRRGWELSRTNPTFPPASVRDLFGMVGPTSIRNLGLLPYVRRPVLDVLRKFGLHRNDRFMRFIEEQLMITSQSDAAGTPFLIGAMGLAYPGETLYAEGGMYGVAGFLEECIHERGGEIRTKRKVKRLWRDGNGWTIETNRETFRAERVISNATIWDMQRMTEQGRDAYFERLSSAAGTGWGAYTLYTAVEDTFDDGGSLYHQIHTGEIPYGGSESIFASLSPSDDRGRAPEGWRTMTVSTHIPDPGTWEELAQNDRDEYERRKGEIEETVLRALGSAFPGFADAERRFTLSGTPRTFGFYTRRMHGMVGGVPHSIERSLFRMPKYRTPLRNLYCVGDTVYPGQGVPAVVLGALNLVDELDRIQRVT